MSIFPKISFSAQFGTNNKKNQKNLFVVVLSNKMKATRNVFVFKKNIPKS